MGYADRAGFSGHADLIGGSNRGPVGRRGDNGAMSDDDSGLHVRQTPRKRTGEAQIADFTMLVRVPGQPAAVRVYTAAEQGEAARYASEVGGVVVSLPLSPPAGYTPDPSGSLIPSVLSAADRAPA
jgi:hypothetical protein